MLKAKKKRSSPWEPATLGDLGQGHPDFASLGPCSPENEQTTSSLGLETTSQRHGPLGGVAHLVAAHGASKHPFK